MVSNSFTGIRYHEVLADEEEAVHSHITCLCHFDEVQRRSITVTSALLATAAVMENTGLRVAPRDSAAAAASILTVAAAAPGSLLQAFGDTSRREGT